MDCYVGVEKNNDCARRNYMSSNHLDASKEVIVTEGRLEQLSTSRRVKRGYSKRDVSYWSDEIYTKRRRT